MEWSGDGVLLGGRLMIVLAGGILLLLIFAWSRSLWGWPGAVVSLALAVFSPTLLAHATLATSDIFLATTYFAATWSLPVLLQQPSLFRVLLSGMLCGLAALSKYSAIMLIPSVIGIVLVVFLLRTSERPLSFFSRRLLGLTGAALVAYAVIWAGYEFRYEALNPELPETSFIHPWESLRTDTLPSHTIAFFRRHQIFPEAYLYGAEHTWYFSRNRESFFLGKTSPGGHRLYFPVAFVLKSTPVLLAGLVLLAALGIFRRLLPFPQSLRLFPKETLWSTGAVAILFFLFCVFSNLNIGNRHMLPVFPFLFLWLGGLWPLLEGVKFRKTILAGGLAIHAGIAIAAMPAFLSYFNPLAGGSKAGYRYFADSSYDWGQEVYLLADWLDRHGQKYGSPQLVLFAPMRPEYYGIQGRVLYQFGAGYSHGWTAPEIRPGLVAVSATMLSGTYFFTNGMDWDEQDERNYRLSRALIAEAQNRCGSDPEAWRRHFAENRHQPWATIFQNYSRLRIKRLLSILRRQKPLVRLSDTIFIWELTEAQYREEGFAAEPAFSEHSIIPALFKSQSAY
ncbi:MAG: ArnT family glycosyltransferase [Desulfosudaceae bacterium]